MPRKQTSPNDPIRLFIAVDIPDAAREALGKLQSQLNGRDHSRAVRWSSISGMHLTLKFLGDTPPARLPDIEAAMAQAVQGVAPFDLNVEGVGCFPDMRKPRVVWAGCSGDVASLHKLRDAVERTVSPLGFPTEDRPFSPHLTIARARQEASRDALSELGRGVAALDVGILASWPVHEIALFRTEFTPSGAVYTALSSAPLPE
jgi:2'-5' RNA ligase